MKTTDRIGHRAASFVAVVVREPDGPVIDESQVISQLKAELAGFKVPKAVHFMDELPRNAMGKVQKNVLRDQFGA
ncbi:acyl-CoA synthetase (AMP-forming)/AMP-acid ligase II [Natronocella acetinitrilica]|uniref:Acyl-CoA synthetase (AMP-forming)/AMP-acid ligase II n=1 Tax=Natronocella acetinitrilica TaxID=414046 RepID=A0AAE3G5J4_9GAMM|nr:hypothetical protein [Natronocella acetinitrilica]MCP1676300.1 acyl-CoA synthetase (AMP-forming)/AMP-acid ligase II [Natronocella acetinitrilica]